MWTRRQWLKGAGALGIQVSLVGTGCIGQSEVGCATGAIFEVGEEGCLLSVFCPEATSVLVQVRERDSQAIVHEQSLDIDARWSLARVTISGLARNTSYQLELSPQGDLASTLYELLLAPGPTQDVALHFVFSADIDVSPAWQSPIFSSMAASGAQFFVSLGDWPYADNPPGAFTEDEFHQRHIEARVDERVQRLLRAMPCYAIYDDHELRNNWDGHFSEVEGPRIEAGLRVWDRWFPLLDTKRYRSLRRGKHLEIFLLDTRLYRSANTAPDDAQKTMLGQEQLNWLLSGLRESNATFKVIITTVPLDYGMTEDSWAAFTNERNKILATITQERIQTVVFLCADQHFFSPHHFQNGIKEFQVGPLARGLFDTLAPQQPDELMRANVLNYGEVKIKGGADPSLLFIARDQNGIELYRERIMPGVGVLRIAGNEGRPFKTSGAHVFRGTSPAVIPYAAAGAYTLRWTDTDEKASDGILAREQELILS